MIETPCILLVDNGSHRAQATLSLRRIAAALSEKVGHKVNPVSLLHSTKVDPSELNGEPAQIFEPFIKAQRKAHVQMLVEAGAIIAECDRQAQRKADVQMLVNAGAIAAE